MLFVLSAFIVPASVQAQWVVSDPGNLVQGIVNSVNEIVETSETAQNALSTWKETSKIFEQGREYYNKLRKVNDLISGSEKVKESVLMLGNISEIYVNNFGKMLADKNFSQRELNAIAAGYNTIMKKSSRSITELKNIINPTGMSMNDKERIDLVNRVYREWYIIENWPITTPARTCMCPICVPRRKTSSNRYSTCTEKMSVTGNHSIKSRIVCC